MQFKQVARWVTGTIVIAVAFAAVCAGVSPSRAGASHRPSRSAPDRVDAREAFEIAHTRFHVNQPALSPRAFRGAVEVQRRAVLDRGTVRSLAEGGRFLEPKLESAEVPALARVGLPRTADGPFSITDVRSGRSAEIRWIDALPVSPVIEAGVVVYDDAVPNGAWFHRVTDHGTEDFVLFNSPAEATAGLRYELRPGTGLDGLRVVANGLELLDASGEPKLRASPPWLIDSRGEVREARLSVHGCEVDTNPAGPWGRPVTRPGADRCRVEVRWDDSGLQYPILVDPSWSSTGVMAIRRANHILKGAGTKVLAAGGIDWAVGSPTATAELYCTNGSGGCTPGTWAYTGSMSTARWAHSAIAYSDLSGGGFNLPSGTVMVIGGMGGLFANYLATCETYNASTGSWTAAPSMSTARALPGVARYDTLKLLAAGGFNSGGYLSSAERLTWGAQWVALPSMGAARAYHTTTTLFATYPTYNANQTPVLVAGGHGGGNPVGLARRYEPASNAWVDAGAMYLPVDSHTATQVLAGAYQFDVFIGGGNNGSGTQRVLQRYRRSTATWQYHATVGDWRRAHSATLLGDNQTILFVAGMGPSGAVLNNAYAYNTNTSSGTSSTLPAGSGREWHGGALISSNQVLIAGGDNAVNSLDTALIYTH